ncbi:MAG: hypothetical protein ABLQ96_03935 [Candidatus Acidiferrum sp.]
MFQQITELLGANRLGNIIIHSGLQAAFFVAHHGMRGHDNDRQVAPGDFLFVPDCGGGLVPVLASLVFCTAALAQMPTSPWKKAAPFPMPDEELYGAAVNGKFTSLAAGNLLWDPFPPRNRTDTCSVVLGFVPHSDTLASMQVPHDFLALYG